MFGRRLFASATAVMLVLTATAVQAAPSATTTVSASWSSGNPGDRFVSLGQITLTEAPDGTVTLSFDITFTVACEELIGASTTTRWQATDVPASLSVKNNLTSATATADVVGGFSVTSSCPGVPVVTDDVGPVTVDAVGTNRTLRERTADGVRILTRSISAGLHVGSWSAVVTGEIEKRIG
jgi:hypothetical protein